MIESRLHTCMTYIDPYEPHTNLIGPPTLADIHTCTTVYDTDVYLACGLEPGR
jgi:hypothetical protein